VWVAAPIARRDRDSGARAAHKASVLTRQRPA
jgi:hypothetical protein